MEGESVALHAAWSKWWDDNDHITSYEQTKLAFAAGWKAAREYDKSANPHDLDQHDAACNGMSPCDMATESED